MSDFIKRLNDSSSLTDILIQMEDFLDNLDIFAFKNWFEGEVVDGPNVERHWVSMSLKYDYKQMPDPEGGLRLLKYGAEVVFKKQQEEDIEDHKQEDIQSINNQLAQGQDPTSVSMSNTIAKPKLKKVWIVEIKIPRHFIDELVQMNDIEDIDSEHLQAAHDSDLQAKDAYADDNNQDDSQDETTGQADQQVSQQ